MEPVKPRFHHYRICNHKIYYGYSCNEKPQIDSIRFLCKSVKEAIQKIESFDGDGWIVTTFIIDYGGEDGVITDSRFKKYAA